MSAFLEKVRAWLLVVPGPRPGGSVKEFRCEHWVNTPLEHCYLVLSDFARYHEWSSSHHRVERQGQELGLYLRRASQPEGKPLFLRAQIRREEPPTRLAWGGGLSWAPWLVDIHHYFELSDHGEGTLLVHGERFCGIVAHLYGVVRSQAQLRQYRRFNEAFARRCEELL